MLRKWWILTQLIVLALLSQILLGSRISRLTANRPEVTLTNLDGQKTAEFEPLDAVFASFSRLRPNTRYDIRIVRSDGKALSHSHFTADQHGIIPTTALWWDVGVEYTTSRAGKLNLPAVFQYTYSCQLMLNRKTVVEIPIRIRPVEETIPMIYSSDENANPLNGFAHRKESVYVTGRNFPPRSKLHIYVVPDQYTWEFGDRLNAIRKRPIVLQLDDNQRDFTTSVWPANQTRIGSYDVIVEYRRNNGVFEHWDSMDSHAGVGFTVFALSGAGSGGAPTTHIEEDLACQAPPQDAAGNVIGAPNPVYKDMFAEIEEVWVAVNPKAGGGNYAGKQARLYVVAHKTSWADGDALNDISSDGYEQITVQPGCANVNYHKVWANPSINNYDVIVHFGPFGASPDQYKKGTDIIDKVSNIGFYVPNHWVCLETISFDHSSSGTSDGVNICINKNDDVTVPEWQKSKQSYPAAYIRNKNITVKAKISVRSGVTGCKIRAVKQYGPLADITLQTLTFGGATTKTFSLNVSAPTPNHIASSHQKWKWYCQDVGGSGSSQELMCASQNKVFVLLAAPVAPMAEPWANGVLDRACWWANGQTNEADTVAKLTDGAYKYTGVVYCGYGSHAYGSIFDLSAFLNQTGSSYNPCASFPWADCQDMSAYLHVLSRALGVSSVQMRKIQGPFQYHPILPIGHSSWNSGAWNFHRVGHYNNKVYDACLMLNQSAPIIPKNMDINGNYKTGLFKSGSWTPQSPFSIQTIY